jgi:hypothetical protein
LNIGEPSIRENPKNSTTPNFVPLGSVDDNLAEELTLVPPTKLDAFNETHNLPPDKPPVV